MEGKRRRCKNAGMKCLEKARKAAKLNEYQMAQRLGISQTSYKHLASVAKSSRPDITVRAQMVAEQAGIALVEFWEWYKDDARICAEARKGKNVDKTMPLD
jgi:transcriptional regulator with XRE-family HTH domain